MKTGTLVLLIACCGVACFLLALGFRLGVLVALAAAAVDGCLPVLMVMRLRTKRFRRFEAQFPDAIDLLSRAIRAGHAFNTGSR
jgi:tight adherence protein B